jgi:hypothetical protein
MLQKNFHESEPANGKGPLAIKISSCGLRMDASEIERAQHEKATLEEVSTLKIGNLKIILNILNKRF